MALFIFYAMPSSAKLKDTLVHFESFIHLHNYESILYWKQFYNTLSQPRKLFSQILLFCFHSQQNCFTDWRWNMSDIASYTKTRTRGCQNEKRKTTKYHLPSTPPEKMIEVISWSGFPSFLPLTSLTSFQVDADILNISRWILLSWKITRHLRRYDWTMACGGGLVVRILDFGTKRIEIVVITIERERESIEMVSNLVQV